MRLGIPLLFAALDVSIAAGQTPPSPGDSSRIVSDTRERRPPAWLAPLSFEFGGWCCHGRLRYSGDGPPPYERGLNTTEPFPLRLGLHYDVASAFGFSINGGFLAVGVLEGQHQEVYTDAATFRIFVPPWVIPLPKGYMVSVDYGLTGGIVHYHCSDFCPLRTRHTTASESGSGTVFGARVEYLLPNTHKGAWLEVSENWFQVHHWRSSTVSNLTPPSGRSIRVQRISGGFTLTVGKHDASLPPHSPR